MVFAVTGVSRANALVIDIQDGYLDRLLLTPVRRGTLLLGLMTADFVLITALAVPVLLLGLMLGIDVATGVLGIVAFVLLAGLWGLAFTGFPYAIALRTGNPTAVNNAFLLFFPFAFLTTAYLPQEAMTGWLATAVEVQPHHVHARRHARAAAGPAGSGAASARRCSPCSAWAPSPSPSPSDALAGTGEAQLIEPFVIR